MSKKNNKKEFAPLMTGDEYEAYRKYGKISGQMTGEEYEELRRRSEYNRKWDDYIRRQSQGTSAQKQQTTTTPKYYYDKPKTNTGTSGSATGGGGVRSSRFTPIGQRASAGVSDVSTSRKNGRQTDISRQEKSKWINKTITELRRQYKTALDDSLKISPYNTQQKLEAERKAEDLRKKIEENERLLKENNGEDVAQESTGRYFATKENVTAPKKESGKPNLFNKQAAEEQHSFQDDYNWKNGAGSYEKKYGLQQMEGPKAGTKITAPETAEMNKQVNSPYDQRKWISRTISELERQYDALTNRDMDTDAQGVMAAKQQAEYLRRRIEENKKLLQQNDADIAKYEEDWTKGNIDLENRPAVKNKDGSISTVRSITVGYDDGIYVIPTVVDGKVVSDKEAINHFEQTGEYLGRFRTEEEANYYAQKLHNKEAIRTGGGLDIGGDEREMTLYERYEAADPKERGALAQELKNYKTYQDYINAHPYESKEDLERDKAAWDAIHETSGEWIAEQQEIGATTVPEWNQDEISQVYTNLISDIPLFGNNPERNEETDRMLYDYMYGESGWYENNKNNPNFKEELDAMWKPLQSGEIAAIAKEKQDQAIYTGDDDRDPKGERRYLFDLFVFFNAEERSDHASAAYPEKVGKYRQHQIERQNEGNGRDLQRVVRLRDEPSVRQIISNGNELPDHGRRGKNEDRLDHGLCFEKFFFPRG